MLYFQLVMLKIKCLNLFFRSVFDQSNELCKTRYQKPAFKEDQTFLDKLQKGNITHFNAKQKYAFRGIFSWRNAIARQEDESEHYVWAHHMFSRISNRRFFHNFLS